MTGICRCLLYVIISFPALCAGQSQAQSMFLERGERALGLSAGFSSSCDAKCFSVEVGHSHNGISEFGFTLGWTAYQDVELRNVFISPHAGFHLIKQSPFSLAATTRIVYQDFKGEFPKFVHIEVWGFGCLTTLYKTICISKDQSIIPLIGISYNVNSTSVRATGGTAVFVEDESTFAFHSSAYMTFVDSPRGSFYLGPHFTIDEHTTTIGLTFGAVLGRKTLR